MGCTLSMDNHQARIHSREIEKILQKDAESKAKEETFLLLGEL